MKRSTETVVLYQGDDMARLEELRIDAEAAQQRREEFLRRGNPRGGDTAPDPKPAQDAFDAFVDEAAERAEEVVVQSLGRLAFRDLRMAHPPRKVDKVIDGETTQVTHEVDAIYGVNTETFPRDLLAYVDPEDPDDRTIFTPEMTASQLKKFLDKELTEGQFDSLWITALGLNKRQAIDPKALRYSATTATSGETTE